MYDSSFPLIFITCDKEYTDYLTPFLYFLDRNTTRKQVFIQFINVDGGTVDSILARYPFIVDHSNISISLNTKNTKRALPPFPPLRHSENMFVDSTLKQFGKLYSEKSAYCANARYAAIHSLLESTDIDVIYIDVDNIINGDLEHMYNLLKINNILTVPCHQSDPRISTTLFGVKNTADNTLLFKDIKNIVETKKYDWGIDHLAINKLITSGTSHTLPEEFYDANYGDKSIIWINHLTMYGITDKYQEIINEIHLRPDSVL